MQGMVTRRGALDMQVCVPSDWTDDQVKQFVEAENPCGTENGWQIRREEAGAKDAPNFCESCAMDLVTCDCANPRPVRAIQSPEPV